MTSGKFGRLSSTVHQFLGQALQSKFHAYEMKNTNQHQHPPSNLPTQGEYEHFHSGWGLWGQQKSPCENLGQTSCICVAYLGKNKCCKYKFTFFGSYTSKRNRFLWPSCFIGAKVHMSWKYLIPLQHILSCTFYGILFRKLLLVWISSGIPRKNCTLLTRLPFWTPIYIWQSVVLTSLVTGFDLGLAARAFHPKLWNLGCPKCFSYCFSFFPSFFFRFSLILFNISLPLQHFKQNNYQIAMIKCCSCWPLQGGPDISALAMGMELFETKLPTKKINIQQ